MRVAGFGLRRGATPASLRAALDLAGAAGLDALAVVEDKAHLPGIVALAEALGLPLHAIAARDLASGITLSEHQPKRYGPTSVAEGAALAAAGPGSVLTVARTVAPDGQATVAVAEGPG